MVIEIGIKKMSSVELNRVQRLLNHNKARLGEDPLLKQALAEVELAKKSAQYDGSQKDSELVLQRMGIRFDAAGSL